MARNETGRLIQITGARAHNLRNIAVSVPRNRLVVVTGVSGSGKSSLVFDTIFAAAQHEFLESLSAYARERLPATDPPDVSSIDGLSPCILVDQRPLARNPRSTVGTVTDAFTFVRLLYSRLSGTGLDASAFSFNSPVGACETCNGLGVALQINLQRLLDENSSLSEGAILHRAWRVGSRYWNIIKASGAFDMHLPIRSFPEEKVRTLLYAEPQRLRNKQPGYVQSFSFEGVASRLLKRLADSRGQSGRAYDKSFFDDQTCPNCNGSRLNATARSSEIAGLRLDSLLTMEIQPAIEALQRLPVTDSRDAIASVIKRLRHLTDVGLGYLTLSRSVATLSSGEAQRVKLARQLGSLLTEMIYVLDEPTSGLHARDVQALCDTLRSLVQKPNSVIVVEHDRSMMIAADHIIDIGPGAGRDGGLVIAQGKPQDMMKAQTATGLFLRNGPTIGRPTHKPSLTDCIQLRHATLHNLKDISVKIPRKALTAIVGVSGSGKSSLAEVLLAQYPETIQVDQSPPGRNVRSNPATYIGVFDSIRKEFARACNQDPRLFTFNGQGACKDCGGLGYHSVDMHFLGESRRKCDTCDGNRFREEVLSLRFKGINIAEALRLTAEEAADVFDSAPVKEGLTLLRDVGLGYLQLGQPLNSLSGGEAQRIKLVSRLKRHGHLYILDEPTRGLHHADVERLLSVLRALMDGANTVIVIEHNLEVISAADWIIELGPEGGDSGGQVIAQGTPSELPLIKSSKTGPHLVASHRTEAVKDE